MAPSLQPSKWAKKNATRKLWRQRPEVKAKEKAYAGLPAQRARQREWWLQTQYGISSEDYDRMLVEQHGLCAICFATEDRLHVDHCHRTGVVRGLLCSKCNQAIGLLDERIDSLQRAIQYLEKE